MPLMDYHLHTDGSVDSREPMAAICRRAVEIGLAEICITEHYDTDPYDRGYGVYDDSRYEDHLAAAREKFAGRLVIRKGLEFDFQSRHASRLADRLSHWKFDFLLGSVHNIYNDMVRLTIERRGFPPDEVYREYFFEVAGLISTGLPHCLGHLDYVWKVCADLLPGYRYADYDVRMKEVTAQLAAAGMGLEVNSRYLDAGQPVVPPLEVLRMFREAGGRIVTLGSDAHAAGEVGAGLPEGCRMLRAAGFTQFASFVSGRPFWHPLPE